MVAMKRVIVFIQKLMKMLEERNLKIIVILNVIKIRAKEKNKKENN